MSIQWTEEELLEYQKTGKWPTRKKKNKYGAKPVKKSHSLDGRFYHSRGEHRRSGVLQSERDRGLIVDLEFQPAFQFVVNGHKICGYTGDFKYRRCGESRDTIEDFKGCVTQEFKIKWALMHALFGETFNLLLTGKQKNVRRKFNRNSRRTNAKH